MPSNYAIIVAGGSGTRMGNGTPKQFLPLAGMPVLMHTIKKFHESNTQPRIVVALPANQHKTWELLCSAAGFEIPHATCNGGDTRFQSVKNSLAWIKEQPGQASVIAVHDAARPLISSALIDKLFLAAKIHSAVVPAVQSIDSVRLEDDQSGENHAFPRNNVWLVQTPQAFDAKTLIQAYHVEEDGSFTDDASVVEAMKIPIKIIDGEYNNLKITFPADIDTAEFILAKGH